MKRSANKSQSLNERFSLSIGKVMLLLAAVFFFGAASAHAQVKDNNPLAGLWQFMEENTRADGQQTYVGKQIYKTITTDNRYFVILGVNIPLKEANSEKTNMSTVTFITQEGEIEMTSENTYLEYINRHYLDKSLNNTISNLRFRFNEKNPNILYIEYNISGNDDNNWVSEVWMRVMPYGAR